MKENKLLPLPIVLWLCGWETTHWKHGVKRQVINYESDSFMVKTIAMDGVLFHNAGSDRDCFWATVRAMEQMPWAKKIQLMIVGLGDVKGSSYGMHYGFKTSGFFNTYIKEGQTPLDCLVAMVSEIYWSGACK